MKKVHFGRSANSKSFGMRRASSSSFTPPQPNSGGDGWEYLVRRPLRRMGDEVDDESSSVYETEPTTPSDSKISQRSSYSTGCRPSGLRKRAAASEKQQSKKQLQFDSDTGLDEGSAAGNDVAAKPAVMLNNNGKTREQLVTEIKIAQQGQRAQSAHDRKKLALQADIEMWKNAFATAVDELQSKLVSHVDKSVLLEQLQIPKWMLKYVND